MCLLKIIIPFEFQQHWMEQKIHIIVKNAKLDILQMLVLLITNVCREPNQIGLSPLILLQVKIFSVKNSTK